MSERKIAGVRVISGPLDPMTALELGPEAAMVLGPALAQYPAVLASGGDLTQVGRLIVAAAAPLGKGALAALAPKLLAATAVVVGEGAAAERIELSSADEINRAFAGDRMRALLGAIVFAGEETFGPLFAGAAALLPKPPPPAAPSAPSAPVT